MLVLKNKCKNCKICINNCPIDAIEQVENKAKITDKCVSCGICLRVCPFEAIVNDNKKKDDSINCNHCPVSCNIPVNQTGACGRYTNTGKEIKRNRKIVVESLQIQDHRDKLPNKPLITAVGSGTNYPCCEPAPHIVEDNINGIDIVTVVTEAPLSYSGVKVKIDTNLNIGEEGSKVTREGKVVGMVTTEEYGSKMLTIGGANLLSNGNDGFIVARTIVDLVNSREVILKVKDGSELKLQQGKAPIIDGEVETLMRVGCGSATVGLFAEMLSKVADETIVLDYHVIGLLTEHLAGQRIGLEYSGVLPKGTRSTVGRFFGKSGNGMGGTDIKTPIDAVESVDMSIADVGDKILVTETTGQKAGLLEIMDDGSVREIPMTDAAKEAVNIIADTCEKSLVSVIYTGGTGGSARGGVTKFPRKITDAVHNNKVKFTIAGSPTYILPGGGINFMANVDQMVENPITWVPTPATVAPVEYTMNKKDYLELGGHEESIVTKEELLEYLEKNYD